MFQLRDLLDADNIVLQCHDFPDADALASAFAIYTYLIASGKKARIIYAGSRAITKPNLTEMVKRLSIPIEHVKEMPPMKSLVMVDCQYGEKNATRFDAETVFTIDHHAENTPHYRGVIHSFLGSCSTLVWDLLRAEQFDFSKYPDVSTALYYGLYTDTNSLAEIAHPLDKDMLDSLVFDRNLIDTMRFNNLTLDEINIAGAALTQYTVIDQYGYAVFRADDCDRNVLGFISDLAIQIQGIDICIVYNTVPNGYQLSIRCCRRDVMANDFARYLSGGGGHSQKAGGFISKAIIEAAGIGIDDLIKKRAWEYFNDFDVIDTAAHSVDVTAMSKYMKRKIPVGYLKTTDICVAGTPLLIRTMESDIQKLAAEDIYLMIGAFGEVYPISLETFSGSYAHVDDHYEAGAFEMHTDHAETVGNYIPTIRNQITGEFIDYAKLAKTCIPTGDAYIYAMPVTKNTKVFSHWVEDGYMLATPGDYVAIRSGKTGHAYVIRKGVFEKTYKACQ